MAGSEGGGKEPPSRESGRWGWGVGGAEGGNAGGARVGVDKGAAVAARP